MCDYIYIDIGTKVLIALLKIVKKNGNNVNSQ